MKFIRYFLFIASNWNILIAWHIIIQEINGEKKYNINTTGNDNLKGLIKKGIAINHATIYMPASYDILEKLFSFLSNKKPTHFLDIGCGKGRALCVAAHNGYTKITGIDFSEKLCKAAETNLFRTKEKFPTLEFQILNEDASNSISPSDVDCIFLFNPFDHVITEKIKDNLIHSLQTHPRKLTIAYANPLYKNIFLDNGFTETYYSIEKKYLEISIMENNPNDSFKKKGKHS